ncbi:hypothetical protein FSP39_016297 [Pinctada imbricata]|uniref:PML C-terminal domain-containing protein n=1 Tax=Pinctada imbricata TaxID=66713 RepID=A0AA88YJP4_PINIB|nr:hypothetical protein FSP39_016297 [Pinctada imbricata]
MHNIFYREHDARCDVDALQRLFSQVPCQLCSLHTRFCSADCDSLLRRWYYSEEIDKNLPSLQSLIDSKALSKCMARKVAGSGPKYCHLELAFRRDPDNGISNLFIEQTGTGANRVTKSKKVVTQVHVVEYFAKLREC